MYDFKSKLKISVVTASYNSHNTILDTLESLRAQDYSNVEHVIIDKNSSDGTVNLVQDNSIPDTVIVSEHDDGIYQALNKGIGLAAGDVIGFLHSDDIYYNEGVLSAVADTFNSEGCDAVCGDLSYFSHKNGKIVRNWKTGSYKQSWLRFGWMPPHPSLFIRKDIYHKHGAFDENFKISGDYDLVLRLFYQNNINAVHCPRVKIGMRSGGASNQSFRNIIVKMSEDIRAMKSHGINPVFGIIGKNLSKIRQFF